MGITKRDIVKCIIFSIITCGIYCLYWFIKLTDDTNTLAGETNGTDGVKALIFTLVTCGIYGYYWAYKQGVKIDSVKAAKGQQTGNLAVIYLILEVVGLGIVAYAMMQNEINNLAE
jgi:hypothetical protein